MTAKLTRTVSFLVVAIGAIAFYLSYDALASIAAQNGYPGHRAYLWPLLIDAPLVVFTLALLNAQLQRQKIVLWAGLVILYTAATVGFNVAHGRPTVLGWLVAIAAPVGLLLTTEALRSIAKNHIERGHVTATVEDLTAQTATLTADIERLTGQRERLQDDVKRLRTDKKERAYSGISDTTKAEAKRILAERSAISGAELGRLLGKSESTGRKLKRELTNGRGSYGTQ